MKHANARILAAATTLVFCILAASSLTPTRAKDQWQRVYTGADSIIEFNTSTLRFGPNNVLRADFRTVLSNSESMAGDRSVKYKTRLETIDFRLTDRRYRFYEISLLDSAGKIVQTASGSEDWRVLKPGGITERLFDAACALTPLGAWKVVAYRFVDRGDPKEAKTTPELDRLVGVNVHLHVDRADVGERICNSPSFQDKDSVQDESLRQLGIDWKSIGIRPEDARTINVRCEGDGWQPPQSLLIKDNRKEEMLMLWDGVFLVLKRDDGRFHGVRGSGLPSLKRRQP